MWASVLDSTGVGGNFEKWGNFCFLKWEVVGEVIIISQLFNTYSCTRIPWLPKWVIYTWCKQTRSTSHLAFNRISGNPDIASSFGPRDREVSWLFEDRWNVSSPCSCSWFSPLYAPLFSLPHDHLLIVAHLQSLLQMLLFPLSLFLPSYVLQQLCFLSSQPTSHCGAFLTQLAPGQHSHRCQSRSVQECITHSTWRRGKASLGLGKQLVQHSHLVAKSKMATKTHMVEPWEIPQPPICASAVWAAFKHLSVQNKMMTSTGTKQLFRTTSS